MTDMLTRDYLRRAAESASQNGSAVESAAEIFEALADLLAGKTITPAEARRIGLALGEQSDELARAIVAGTACDHELED